MPGQKNKVVFLHDFDGECAPAIGGTYTGCEGFSVGIFRWIPKTSGRGLKKGKVIYRVRGKTNDAERVYAQAREMCKIFDDAYLRNPGFIPGKKSETVK